MPTEADTTIQETLSSTTDSPTRKSPGRAVLYSVAGTALLAPAAGVGFVVGPAFGHFYAGNTRQAWTGIGLRFASLGSAGLGGILALGAPRVGWTLLTVGILATGGSILYDTVTAWHSATDYNESHGVHAQLTPAAGPQGKQVGLALRITF